MGFAFGIMTVSTPTVDRNRKPARRSRVNFLSSTSNRGLRSAICRMRFLARTSSSARTSGRGMCIVRSVVSYLSYPGANDFVRHVQNKVVGTGVAQVATPVPTTLFVTYRITRIPSYANTDRTYYQSGAY